MTTIRLHELLGLTQLPANGMAWHDLLVEGLDPQAIPSLARRLGVSPDDLAGLILDESPREGDRLSRHASNFLYRIALAMRHLEPMFAGDLQKAVLWLRNPQAALKQRIPILLLQTHIGSEYVMTAISRLKPAGPRFEGNESGDDAEEASGGEDEEDRVREGDN